MSVHQHNERRNVLLTVLVVYALLGVVAGHLRFFSPHGLVLVSGMVWKWAACIAASLVVWRAGRWLTTGRGSIQGRASLSARHAIAPEIFLVGFVVILMSDFTSRRWVFSSGDHYTLKVLALGVGGVLALAAFARFLPRVLTHRATPFVGLLMLQLIIARAFLVHADGRLLFSDDHPSFLYRLYLLREHFPHIPFYNADWNAGYSAREFFPSGILNVFLVALPFVYWGSDLGVFESAANYTIIITYVFLFLVPWSVYAAVRVLGGVRWAAFLGALFALGPSLGHFEWFLKFGTLGFSFSAALVPLTIALAYRLAAGEARPLWRDVLFLLLVSFCCVTWSLSFIALLPVTVFGLLRFRTTFSPTRRAKVIGFLALFLLVNGPWMYTFVRESQVLSFLSGSALPGSTTKSIVSANARKSSASKEGTAASAFAVAKKQLRALRENVVKVNVLLLLFVLPGLSAMRRRSAATVLGSTVVWLLLVAWLGDMLKPQLELRRMVIPAAFVMCVLAGIGIYSLIVSLLKTTGERHRAIALRGLAVAGLAIVLGGVFISPIRVYGAYQNRSEEKFKFASPTVGRLSDAIREHGGEGRTFFLGFILHDLETTSWNTQDGGHIAPLAAFSGKPLYASDFYHARWSTVDPIPASFRKRGSEGTEEFLDLVNATAVVTFKREWVDYCLNHPSYRQVFQEDRFRVFVRETEASYFIKGSGTVKREHDGLSVVLGTPEVVLKYRYLRNLKVLTPSDVSLSSVFAFEEDLGGKKSKPVHYIRLVASPEVVKRQEKVHLGFFAR